MPGLHRAGRGLRPGRRARTRAVLDGDEWVVNGQKVWSSYAHIADWCILAGPLRRRARRSTAACPTCSSTCTRRASRSGRCRQITGDPEFNEIFFTDVRVPREPTARRDRRAAGSVAMTTLLHERGTLGFALTAALERSSHLVGWRADRARRPRAADDPLVRDRIAAAWIDLQALRFTNYRVADRRWLKTGVPGPEGSVAKLHWSETNQRLTKLAFELLGPGRRSSTATAASGTATGNTSSCAAAATPSRPAPPRSCATSSPSASSACPGPADRPNRSVHSGLRLLRGAGAAAGVGPRLAGRPLPDRPGRRARRRRPAGTPASWKELAELGWLDPDLGLLEHAVLAEEIRLRAAAGAVVQLGRAGRHRGRRPTVEAGDAGLGRRRGPDAARGGDHGLLPSRRRRGRGGG